MWSIGAGFFFAFFDVVSIGLALPKIVSGELTPPTNSH
jgi:hypothetical protein